MFLPYTHGQYVWFLLVSWILTIGWKTNCLVDVHAALFKPFTWCQISLRKFPPLPQFKPLVHVCFTGRRRHYGEENGFGHEFILLIIVVPPTLFMTTAFSFKKLSTPPFLLPRRYSMFMKRALCVTTNPKSKVQFLFCFETCTTEVRGGEKGGSVNSRTKRTEPLTQGSCSPLYIQTCRRPINNVGQGGPARMKDWPIFFASTEKRGRKWEWE